MFKYKTDQIELVEVGPRDGLQNESKILKCEDKLRYIELLYQAGLKNIEATSFVRADKIPQMQGASELFKKLSQKSFFHNAKFPCLVPNIKGYESAVAVGVKEISLFSATSDAFTKKNINCTVDESFSRMQEVATRAHADNVKIRAYISTAFGCPYAGEMSSKDLVHVIEKFLDLGVYQISIGDTIGVATPKQVYSYLGDALSIIDASKVAMHFHDTRAMALSNILTSLERGITVFDSSSAGLGGCPYAKGASGNVATEEVVYLLHSLGLKTGVDMDKLVLASEFILKCLEKTSSSKYYHIIARKS